MRRLIQITLSIVLATVLYACGSTSALEDKKAKLDAYQAQLAEINANISRLEREIAEEDPNFDPAAAGRILVAGFQVNEKPFEHKVEMRGSVASRKNVMVSAETMGRITAVHVTEGQNVTKGQLLISLDASILRNNAEEVKTQLELATAVFDRQARLWEQQIGTEIQYLQAKNNKESIERRLATLQSQLDQASVRAPFAGAVDNIPVKVGEMAQPGLPLIRVVNPDEMYIKADVSEAFLGKFKKGNAVEVFFPVQGVRFSSKVVSTGQVINDQNRTFELEVSIASNVKGNFRPNQVAVITMTDYYAEKALAVPTSILQSDASGFYLYTIEHADGKFSAQKRNVTTGQSYGGFTEVTKGLNNGAEVIEKGFLEVSDGAEVTQQIAAK